MKTFLIKEIHSLLMEIYSYLNSVPKTKLKPIVSIKIDAITKDSDIDIKRFLFELKNYE